MRVSGKQTVIGSSRNESFTEPQFTPVKYFHAERFTLTWFSVNNKCGTRNGLFKLSYFFNDLLLFNILCLNTIVFESISFRCSAVLIVEEVAVVKLL